MPAPLTPATLAAQLPVMWDQYNAMPNFFRPEADPRVQRVLDAMDATESLVLSAPILSERDAVAKMVIAINRAGTGLDFEDAEAEMQRGINALTEVLLWMARRFDVQIEEFGADSYINPPALRAARAA